MITFEMLKKIAPTGKTQILQDVVKYFNIHAPKYGMTTYLRIAHWAAQSAHESAGFRTLEEYASGSGYEGREDLGNVRTGDGIRYKGRGIFQLTGRSNYAAMGKKLGVDLENNPTLAATPEISVLTSLEYWKSRNLSKYADADDVLEISKKINGVNKKTGLPNGLTDRKHYLAIAKTVIPKTISTNVETGETSEPSEIVAKLGDKSAYVKELQLKLVKAGNSIVADGDFGPRTQTAVKAFQKSSGLPETGSIDKTTLVQLMLV